jgi:hypothetical protein
MEFVVLALFLAATLAHAQDAPCDASFDINRMIEGMNKVDASFDAFDAENARVILKSIRDDAPCLRDRVHPNHLVRFARQMATSSFFDQDELEMAYWAQLAFVNPEVPWPPGIAPDHPVRDQLEFIDPEMPLDADGELAVPKGGGMLIDGQLVVTPTTPPDSPHFVQVLDRDGTVLDAYWQDGVVFPERWLADEPTGTPPGTPKWYQPVDWGVDPFQKVTIDPAELERRAEARKAAEEAMRKERERAAAALEKERERAERRAAKAERRARKNGESTEVAVVEQAATDAAPKDWVSLSFDEDKERLDELDPLEKGTSEVGCADLRRLEPRSLMGRLTQEQILCLELRLRREERMTAKNKTSRVLMADAWTKKDIDRWEAAVRRHLEEIDRSDADLAYIFARHLANKPPEHIPEAIRWSNVALTNAYQWEGEQRVKRMYALHRINAVAAQQLWLAAEDDALVDQSRENVAKANFWRNQTKSLSREWLSFATEAGEDPAASLDLCMSAAGTTDYCIVE